jgi:hypothetical protein
MSLEIKYGKTGAAWEGQRKPAGQHRVLKENNLKINEGKIPKIKFKKSIGLVRERTIPTGRPPRACEVTASFRG